MTPPAGRDDGAVPPCAHLYGNSRRHGYDRITLTGVRGYGYHGVFPEERENGQDFIVDVVVWSDVKQAASWDDIHTTLNYGVVAQQIVAVIMGDPVNLIETLAEKIAQHLLVHQSVGRTRVTVHKPHAPITVPFADVSVTVERCSCEKSGSEVWVPTVFAIGSNLGDRANIIRNAISDLDNTSTVRITACSALYESEAITAPGEDSDAPRYVNAVVCANTTLNPYDLLDSVQTIEQRYGRVRAHRWADRTLDIDIIVYDGLRIDDDRLTIPHPRAVERAFVLVPWAEIDPHAVLPGWGLVRKRAAEMRETVSFYAHL